MSKIDQKEYLKRYLCSDEKLEKKKKKKSKEKHPKVKQQTVKIIDDDVSAFNGYHEVDESDLYATNEEAPQIVGVIDERAPTVIMKQEYEGSGKWKSLDNAKKDNEKSSKKLEIRHQSIDSKSSEKFRRSILPGESPPRKNRRNSDESPPRRSRKQPSESPPRKNRRKSDESPPRRSRKQPSESPPRKNRRNSDESPPRRSRKQPSESPPRKNRRKSDESPPRRNRRNSNDNKKSRWNRDEGTGFKSPKRRYDRRDSDESPPRKIKKEPHDYLKSDHQRSPIMSLKAIKQERMSSSPDIKREIKRERSPSQSSNKKMTKTLDGKASGLQNAKNLRVENEQFRARQDKLFKEMNPDMSGKNADVVIRDRKGRNRDFEYDMEKERKKMELEEERKKEYDKWGKGLKQLEELEKRKQEYIHEASKPLARSEDDKDLQDYLKNQERLDDPMLQYMRKKRQEENKAKGIVEKPKYNGEFPDNRFNIRPGYRWDGVDRSNGYEKKYFSMINSKKSIEEEAYRYSTEDM